MPYRTPQQRAERDELVARLLAAVPGGITEYELGRRLKAELGQRAGSLRNGGNRMGCSSLVRLEAAGRARCVREPWPVVQGFRRVWFPVEERL